MHSRGFCLIEIKLVQEWPKCILMFVQSLSSVLSVLIFCYHVILNFLTFIGNCWSLLYSFLFDLFKDILLKVTISYYWFWEQLKLLLIHHKAKDSTFQKKKKIILIACFGYSYCFVTIIPSQILCFHCNCSVSAAQLNPLFRPNQQNEAKETDPTVY